jgi:GalNAc-alpha-(1->4)-GalNAc-alpha-(1->3)-diNAcBac-PP-undecaprenol alpha-1,4-N-acetyl-D-galactosaminyltransferase
MGKAVFQFSDLNISISGAVKRFVNKFDSRYSPVIYRGLEIKKDLTKTSLESQIKTAIKDKIVIVTVARLYKWKGVSVGVEAIKKIPLKWKNKIVYVVVGDGEDRERLEERAAGEKNVYFAGALSRKEVLLLLEKTEIYLHTSSPGGGLSTSLLEAMHKKCAVVASPREGADEVLKEGNGILLRKNFDADDMAQKVEILCKDDTMRKKLAKNAQETIKERFSWEKSLQEYREIFSQIIKKS